jgi:hypothetical protein
VATTQDLIQIKTEESPVYEGATTATTPYRLSTVAAYMPIQSARIDPGPQLLDRSDEVRGIEGALARLINGYEPAGSLSVRAYLDSLVFLLNASGMTDTITTGNGVITDPDSAVIPTGAYRHVFTKRGGITAKTLQVILSYVDEGVHLRGNGFGVSGLTLNAAGEVTADLMGLVVANVADPNLTPVLPAGSIYPLRRGDMSLTWLSNSGTTDDFTMSLANPLNRRSSLGLTPPSFFPDKMEHGDERVYLTGSIPKSALADADVDNLISAGTFSATAKWKTPVAVAPSTYKYSMWIQMPACQYVGGQPDELANKRHLGGSFDWFAAWDEVTGYDFKITIVCGISQLEAYV